MSDERPAAGPVVNGRASRKAYGGMRTYFDGVVPHLDAEILTPEPSSAFGVRGHAWEQLRLPRLAGGRALLSPANSGPLRHRRQLVVIHDAAVFDVANGFARSYATQARFIARRLARAGIRIATVSEFSRERLAHHLDLGEDDIVLAPCGVNPGAAAATTEQPSIVCVGGDLGPRKNVDVAVRAFGFVRERYPEATMRVVASPGSGGVLASTTSLRSTDISIVEGPSPEHLRRLVAESWLNVFVPTYEGFGLPLIEAQAVGTPSVVSAIPPLAANAIDGDLVVERFLDAADVGEAMVERIEQPLRPLEREINAAAIADRWRWSTTAETIRRALEELP